MTASSCYNNSLDWCLANQTRFAFSTVHPVLQLEKPFFAVGINIVANRRTAKGYGLAKDFLNGMVEFSQLVARERHRASPGTYACAEKRFVGIDVANTAQKFLIQQRTLDRGLAAPE